jgi:c-di-GMP phosphodiesterase
MMPEPFPLLTRRPLFNSQLKVIGYELIKEDKALSPELLLNIFTEISVQKMVGKHLAFVDYARSLVKNPARFSHQKLVIKVPQSTQVDASMLHALKVLREQRYTLAFDEFVLTPATQHLIPYADIIHLNMLQLSPQQLTDHIRDIQPFGIQLLAKNIASYDMFESCKTLGFELFEGDFFRYPKLPITHDLSEHKHALLELIAGIHNPDAQIEKIEKLVAKDAKLSAKLFRLVNSAAFGAAQKVESLKQAIMLLGINKIKNWVNILVLANLGEKPRELSTSAMIRAHMCELISYQLKDPNSSDTFFTVGLLSTLDAFLDISLEAVLAKLSLKESTISAILHHTGIEGSVLKNVMHYEKAEWNHIDWEQLAANNISKQTLAHIYLDTLTWVESAMNDLAIRDN